jgi:hypothetical protein
MQTKRGGASYRVGAIAIATLVLVAASAAATVVGGGGNKQSDCLLVFDAPVNIPAGKPRHVFCVDGDPACDADGVVNGICEVPVVVCANSTALSDCTMNGVHSITVSHALDNGDPKFDPDFQALQDRILSDLQPPTVAPNACIGIPIGVRVPIKGPVGNNRCGRRSKKVQVTTVSENIGGRVYVDKDTIKLTCAPAPAVAGGCDPLTLFGGTYDRIQKQIFNQSCAVSGCHDSQSQQGNLLLETGASLTNLLNVNPDNIAAANAGWKRVIPGNPAHSYLLQKVEGNFPGPGFGGRMPLNRPKLNKTLRQIIEHWIQNGSPDTGWVPGTF